MHSYYEVSPLDLNLGVGKRFDSQAALASRVQKRVSWGKKAN